MTRGTRSVKKNRGVSVAWDFQGCEESFPGPLYQMSCRGFGNFVKTQTHAVIHSTKERHSLSESQCMIITSPCPLTGLVKSKNNTAHANRALRYKWTQVI